MKVERCECTIHRYDVFHICKIHRAYPGAPDRIGRGLFDHSQGECDDHRFCDMETHPSSLYEHGDTVETLRIKFEIVAD